MAVSVPYSFSPGGVIYSAQVNANFAALVAAANAIYPSGITPSTTVQATFGGSVAYTFPAGIIVNGALAQLEGGNAIALTNGGFYQVGLAAGLNVIGDYEGVQALNDGAASTLQLNSLGGLVTTGGALTAGGALSGTSATLSGNLSAVAGSFSGAVSGTTLTGSGAVTGLAVESKANGSTAAYCPPLFSASGGALAATSHLVYGVVSFTSLGAGNTSSQSVSLSGSAQFTSGTSYQVWCSLNTSLSLTNGAIVLDADTMTASSFNVTASNTSSASHTFSVYWLAIGV